MSLRPFTVLSKLIRSSEVRSVTTRRVHGFSWMFKWLGQDTLIWLQQPLDLTVKGITTRLKNKQWKNFVESQKLNLEARERMGSELAAAKFIMENSGLVKFTGAARWYQKKEDGTVLLPNVIPIKITIEAIDASDTKILYESFENLENLENLRSLNLSNCKYIDDWCIDRLSIFRSSLTVLNLSNCHRVTDNGLGCLHRFKKLRRLILNGMSGIRNPQLTLMMLEEVLPQCFIEGLDYNHSNDDYPHQTPHSSGLPNDMTHKTHSPTQRPKVFLDNWEKQALSAENEKLAQALKLDVETKS